MTDPINPYESERGVLAVDDMRPHHPFRQSATRLANYRDQLGSQPDVLDPDALLGDAVARLNGAKGPTPGEALAGAVPYVVLSADIRKSTFLMKEAEDLTEYARAMTSFIRLARRTVGDFGGWFDKFMGDGFLSYWPCLLYGQSENERSVVAEHLNMCANVSMFGVPHAAGVRPPASPAEYLSHGLFSALSAASLLIKVFDSTHKPEFRRGSRNFRADTGLTIGVDVGIVQIVPIGEEITIVGHPVVGAVRMTSAGEAGQIIANARVGDFALETHDGGSALATLNRRFEFARTTVTTKEYDQEAYVIRSRS